MPTRTISCPKCGFEQKIAEECASCGIVFRKWRGHRKENTSGSLNHSANKLGSSAPSAGPVFRMLRIALLLLVLIIVGGGTLYSKWHTTSWERPLDVIIYPINAEDENQTSEYIQALDYTTFESIAGFFKNQAEAFDLPITDPVNITLADELVKAPPDPPAGGSLLSRIWWSLRLRYYSFRLDPWGPSDTIKVFVLYYNPDKIKHVKHSLGLEKGLIAIVHAFAHNRRESQNNVVVVHELLHTLGATDKYELETERPLYPDGFAEPDKEPLYPQERAEIMAGNIPLSESKWKMAAGLRDCEIGLQTAREIRWIR